MTDATLKMTETLEQRVARILEEEPKLLPTAIAEKR